MHFHVLTLFPEMIDSGCDHSILKRAIAKDLIQVNAIDIREFSQDKHKKVDDYTYGGGAGMLMQAQPVFDAWKSIAGDDETKKPRTIYVTPQGQTFTQKLAKEFAKEENLVILCGHYEGIDERVLDEIVTDRVSIGDYVLTGGELPALVMIDAISRLVPGVLGSEESAQAESFENDLLEYPQYSRPEVWHDKAVPEVLLSGDHKKIEAWRREEAKKRTEKWRPDLYKLYIERELTAKRLSKHKKDNAYMIDALLTGRAKLVFAWGEAAIAVSEGGTMVLLCCDNAAEGTELLAHLENDPEVILHNCEELNPVLAEKYGFRVGDECFQSVYTQHTALPIAHKDIRPYPIDQIDYAVANYGGEDHRSYLLERMQSGEFFAAYEDGEIAGFCGVHGGGSLGMLYVDPKYRRSSIGSSLASYLVNWSLERGGVPYAHIRLSNIASLKMQEKMGLYVAKKHVFWTYK